MACAEFYFLLIDSIFQYLERREWYFMVFIFSYWVLLYIPGWSQTHNFPGSIAVIRYCHIWWPKIILCLLLYIYGYISPVNWWFWFIVFNSLRIYQNMLWLPCCFISPSNSFQTYDLRPCSPVNPVLYILLITCWTQFVQPVISVFRGIHWSGTWLTYHELYS